MKHCPACKRVYSDESLKFCREDGAPLVSDPSDEEALETIVLSDSASGKEAATRLFHESTPSIAVLSFVNMSADPENEYFCDGLAEELLNALAKVEGLKIAARTSAFSFKGKEADIREIGQKLNVSTILEGSVRKSGDRLRITAQLINVEDGYHLWSARYDRKMDDVFEIQDEISLAIVDALKVKLLGEEKAALLKRYTDNAEVYQLYLKGRFYFYKQTEEGLSKAIECYEQALAIEPSYAPAYAELANVYGTLLYFGFLSRNEALPKAAAALEKALALDPDLAEAHLILAKKNLHYEWDWQAAGQEFRRAIELNANSAEAHLFYAFYLGDMGRSDEAIVEGKLAQTLDPLSLHINWGLGFIFLQARRHSDALEQGRKLLEMEQNFFGGHSLIGTVHYLKGEYEAAIAECRKALALGGGPTVLASLGYAYGLSGRRDDALEVIERLREMRRQGHVPASSVAMVYVGLDDKDHAFEWLERAYEEGDGSMASLGVNNTLDSLRADPRFQDLLSRVGLPQNN